MRTSLLAVIVMAPLAASAQGVRKQLTDAVQALDVASIKARRAGGQCKANAHEKIAAVADRLDALGGKVRFREIAELTDTVSDVQATATFNDCPQAVADGIASAMESLEALRVALWTERKEDRTGDDSSFAQLAPLTVNVKDIFEREPAVRVSVPSLTLKGLRGQVFYFGARFRSLQGNWSDWVTTQKWSVPADPFTWKNAFSHLFRASTLAEQDFANGAFVARLSVFDGNGRELAFREARFQVGLPQLPPAPATPTRDCGTGADLGCLQTRDGVFPVERPGYLAIIDLLRAEKNEKKRVKTLETAVAAVYLTAAQFTSLLDLFPGDGPRFDAATAVARRVVNLNDAQSYAARFQNPDLRARYGSLLRSILDPNAQPRSWRVEGDVEHVPFTFEEATRDAIYAKCVTWKEGNIRTQGPVMRVVIKGGATHTDMLRTDAACNIVKDAAVATY